VSSKHQRAASRPGGGAASWRTRGAQAGLRILKSHDPAHQPQNNANITVPKGHAWTGPKQSPYNNGSNFTKRSDPATPKDYGQRRIAYQDGAPVRLREWPNWPRAARTPISAGWDEQVTRP